MYSGERSIFIHLTNGELYSLGEGSYGELGIGKELYRANLPQLIDGNWKKLKKIANGGKHSLAVMKDGELFSWGSGKFGVLCSSEYANVLAPQLIELSEKRTGSIGEHSPRFGGKLLKESQSPH